MVQSNTVAMPEKMARDLIQDWFIDHMGNILRWIEQPIERLELGVLKHIFVLRDIEHFFPYLAIARKTKRAFQWLRLYFMTYPAPVETHKTSALRMCEIILNACGLSLLKNSVGREKHPLPPEGKP